MDGPQSDNAPIQQDRGEVKTAELGGLPDDDTATMRYSRGASRFDNTPEQRTAVDFADFREDVLADVSAQKGLAFICAPMAEASLALAAHRAKPEIAGRPYRSSLTAQPRRFVALDLDKCPGMDALAALCEWMQRFSAFGYTTASHTPQAPRARFIIEVESAMDRETCIATTAALRESIAAEFDHIGLDASAFDPSLDRPEQPIYTPVTGAILFRFDGEPLPLSTRLVGALPAPAATAIAPQTAHVTPEQVAHLRSALAHLRADDRDLWVRMGHALHELGEIGRGLWLEWSQSSDKWTSADARKWDSFHHDQTGYKAVFATAQAHGWANPASVATVPAASAQAVTNADTWHVVPLDDLEHAEHKPPRYIADLVIPVGVVTLVSAHGGAGKSVLSLIIAAHFACGRDLGHYWIDEPGRALFVSLEDDGDLVRFRLRRIAAAYGLPIETLQERLTIIDASDGDAALAVECGVTGVRELIATRAFVKLQAAAVGHRLIVVDNASDGFGGNENDRRQVRMFMRMLTIVARANDAGLLLLAHVDKATARFGSVSDRYSGSTAWHNSARSRLEMTATDGVVTITHAKHTMSAAAAPLTLTWNTDGVLVPASAANAPNHGDDVAALAAAFEDAEKAGAIIPTARRGPATAQHVLETIPSLPANMRGKKGSPTFWSAIAALQREGRLHVAEHITRARNKRERFALVPCAAHYPTPQSQELTNCRSPCVGLEVCVDSEELTQTNELTQCTPDEYRKVRG